jgi:hypothetical protein
MKPLVMVRSLGRLAAVVAVPSVLILTSCSKPSAPASSQCQVDADCSGADTCVANTCVSIDGGGQADAADGSLDASMGADAGEQTDAGRKLDAGTEAGDAGTIIDGGEASDGGDTTDGGLDAGDAGQPTVLAPAGDTAQAGPVDGISCDKSEQLLFHIHAHLAIYVEGQSKLLAAGIGIGTPLQYDSSGFVVGGSCFSWLHTHDESGIIHIESPVQRTFTLGNLFDLWGLKLSPSQVGPAQGAVTTFLNGQPFIGDVTKVPLDANSVVQLDVGSPIVPAQPYTFPPGL